MSSTKDKEERENEEEIRYFSMFTGVGGFELGLGEVDTINRNTDRGIKENKKRNERIKPFLEQTKP
ncbi:MAG: hypothetical protein KJI69_05670 [Patescibacteria group bacterium]|nr:hypothetical protein [Patescibacteria group bacterium]